MKIYSMVNEYIEKVLSIFKDKVIKSSLARHEKAPERIATDGILHFRSSVN